ncbi:MAG: DUF7793 family protein [Bacteroidota bacterium]
MKAGKKIETRVFHTWLQDGICYTKVKEGSVIDLKDAIENTEAVIKVSAGVIYPMLVDLRVINSITKEARDHFSMRNRKPGVNSIAMLVKSPVSSIIGNFFLGLNKPSVPTHLFTSETKALKWLEQFIPN